jgi:hypothetical protein
VQAVPEFPGHIPFYIPFPNIRPFVKGFFPLAEAQFYFDPAFFEIKGQGDKGIAPFFYLPAEAFDFIPVEEEPFFPVRVVVKNRRKGVFRHPQRPEPNFAVYQLRPGVEKGDFAVPERFYLCPQKFYPAFKMIIHRIIVPGLAVYGDNFYPFAHLMLPFFSGQ